MSILKSLLRTYLLELGLTQLFQGIAKTFNTPQKKIRFEGELTIGMRFSEASKRWMRSPRNELVITVPDVQITEIKDDRGRTFIGFTYRADTGERQEWYGHEVYMDFYI